MRTTIDINDALLAEVRELSAREGRPYREVINRVIGLGLGAGEKVERGVGDRAVRIKPHPLEMKPGFAGQSLNQLYDQLEAEDLTVHREHG